MESTRPGKNLGKYDRLALAECIDLVISGGRTIFYNGLNQVKIQCEAREDANTMLSWASLPLSPCHRALARLSRLPGPCWILGALGSWAWGWLGTLFLLALRVRSLVPPSWQWDLALLEDYAVQGLSLPQPVFLTFS